MSSSEDKKMADARLDKAVASRKEAQDRLDALREKKADPDSIADAIKTRDEAKEEVAKWDNILVTLVVPTAGGSGES
jgi:hypothetical protein